MDSQKQLEVGRRYEEYIADKFGIGLVDDKEFQIYQGDGYDSAGDVVEIKYDRQFHKTGRLFIEINQGYMNGTDSQRNGWHQSGPYKLCRWYIIGDCKTVFWLDKSGLKAFVDIITEHRDRYGYPYRKDQNTEGFAIPNMDIRRRVNHFVYQYRVEPLCCEQ